MKKITLMLLVISLTLTLSLHADEKKKSTVVYEGDITPKEAYEMVKKHPENTFILDVRSMAEYEFVGHPDKSYNIPIRFWSPKGFKPNFKFIKDVKKKFKKSDVLLVICRSGKRSYNASNKLTEYGFKHVFNIADGFEGEIVEDKNDPRFGQRGYVNGWKYDKLPYTYILNKAYVYKLHRSCGCDK